MRDVTGREHLRVAHLQDGYNSGTRMCTALRKKFERGEYRPNTRQMSGHQGAVKKIICALQKIRGR